MGNASDMKPMLNKHLRLTYKIVTQSLSDTPGAWVVPGAGENGFSIEYF